MASEFGTATISPRADVGLGREFEKQSLTRLTGEAWEEITKMQRDSRGHYPQGSVLAEGNLQKAARAKVSGVHEDLPAGVPGGRSLPVGLRRVSSPVWFSVPSLRSPVPPASVVPATSLARWGAEGRDLRAPGAGTPASRVAHRAPRAGGGGAQGACAAALRKPGRRGGRCNSGFSGRRRRRRRLRGQRWHHVPAVTRRPRCAGGRGEEEEDAAVSSPP